MSWRDAFEVPATVAAPMTIPDVIAALLERAAAVYVDGSVLKYLGPDLTPDDPLQAGIEANRAMLTELFTYAPGGRCVSTGCYRLLAAGNRIACPDHQAAMDEIVMPWERPDD